MTAITALDYRRVWVLDFEFETTRGGIWQTPVCMVASDLLTGERLTLGPDELAQGCPFDCSDDELFVAFYALAEARCFIELGWPLPPRWIDLWVEHKRLRNGSPSAGMGLSAALRHYRLPTRDAAYKQGMQIKIGTGQWTRADLPLILKYCAEDVDDAADLFRAMLGDILTIHPGTTMAVGMAQAIMRGRYVAETAAMEHRGLPMDAETWNQVRDRWTDIRLDLIRAVDADYGTFDEHGSFKADRWAYYLHRAGIPWPKLESGALALDDDTFSDMAKRDQRIRPVHELRKTLSQMRSNSITVDPDGRTRTPLRPFATITARCAPSTSAFVFAASKWVRSLLQAPPGHTLAYLDYKSEELGIAAVLSGDELLWQTYMDPDPYAAFGRQIGVMPPGATKASHPHERASMKVVVLGTSYGLSEYGISRQAGIHLDTAREILQRHRETYRAFWAWSDAQVEKAFMGYPLWTPCGWRYQATIGSLPRGRSMMNLPIQSTGSDILRSAVVRCARAGIPACTSIHDALAFVVPLSDADDMLATAAREMRAATVDVLGREIGVDIARVDSPKVYADARGWSLYQRIAGLAGTPERTPEHLD